jgi:hypothetical protein
VLLRRLDVAEFPDRLEARVAHPDQYRLRSSRPVVTLYALSDLLIGEEFADALQQLFGNHL